MTTEVTFNKPLVERRIAVLVFLILAGLTVAFANIIWFTSAQSTVTGQTVVISVTGHQGAPAMSATALVSVAAALFLALSGRIAHWVAITVLALSGITIAGSAISLLLNPTPVVACAVSVRRWTLATSKYERPLSPGIGTENSVQSRELEDATFDDRDAWDALSSGVDPTQDSDPSSPVA